MNIFPTKERIEKAYGLPPSQPEQNGHKSRLATLLELLNQRFTLILERLTAIQSRLDQPPPPSGTEERLGQLLDILAECRRKDQLVERLHEECSALRARTFREEVLVPVARDLFLLHDRCTGYLLEFNGQDKPVLQTCPHESKALARETQRLQSVLAELEEALGRLGITKVGKTDVFDPSQHKAVHTEPIADPSQDRRILGTGRTGWILAREAGQPGKVLRQQEVVVGKYTRKEA